MRRPNSDKLQRIRKPARNVLTKPQGGNKLGWRFRRTVKILPGVRLNLSRSGISTTLGRNGASINLGKRGTSATVGIPGTGLSHTSLMSRPSQYQGSQGGTPKVAKKFGCGSWAVVALILVGLGKCMGGVAPPTPVPMETSNPQVAQGLLTASPAVTPDEVKSSDYITGDRVKGRSTPSQTSKIVHILRDGDPVMVVSRKRNWAKVVQNGVTFWVVAKHISSSPRVTPSKARRPIIVKRSQRYIKKRRPAKRAGYSGGSCPCGSGRICTGPRGGRYCITSGGNKRYGV